MNFNFQDRINGIQDRINQVSNKPIGTGTTSSSGRVTIFNQPRATGTAGNDSLFAGTALNAVLSGLGGNDNIIGGAGDDTLDGGDGRDTIAGGSGNDRIIGGGDNDFLTGGFGDDVVSGDGGDDRVFGELGEDILLGGAGKDRVDGGIDADVVDGGDGDDIVAGGGSGDSVVGGRGKDIIRGFGGGAGSSGSGVGSAEIDFLAGGGAFDTSGSLIDGRLYDGEADTFVLGDATGTFYASAGVDDFAYVLDYEFGVDILQFGANAQYGQQTIDYNGDGVGDKLISALVPGASTLDVVAILQSFSGALPGIAQL